MTDLLRPLTFGGLTIENNIFQAPLAGYSSLPFRLLSWRLGRPGLLATEMISMRSLVMKSTKQERYLARSDEEGPISYQLWGRDPEDARIAAEIVTSRGANTVDLNCGCPVRKVRAAGAGSRLMEEPELVGKIVAGMRKGTDLPVTIKIRVGTRCKKYNGPEIAKVAADNGADLIAVHGRHAGEAYSTPVRLDEIRRVVEAVDVPVIGNGDVRDGESARKMMEKTGCAGVMVGRACMGAPWVFSIIKAGLTGTDYTPPAPDEIGRILLQHYDMLAELTGADTAIRHCRKLGSFYSKGRQGGREFRNGLNFCHDRESLCKLIEKYFTGFVCDSGDEE